MKHSITIFLALVCTMCLAAHQSQAKKGCKAYGYACYGGHGKRSLFGAVEMEQNFISSPDAVLMLYSNKPNPVHASNRQDGEPETPPLQLIKILKPWVLQAQPRKPADRFDASEYLTYDDVYNRESSLTKNENKSLQ
ncbi:neuropeptide CCHamide-2 isoform 1-T3 [Glossina fuscipes fuscipes]